MKPRGKLSRPAVACLVAFLVATALIVAIGFRPHAAPNFIGHWRSWRSDLEISADGDRYKIVIDNPKGLLSGLYTGTLHGAVMRVSGPLSPLCGEISIARDSGQLEFCGEEFKRVSSGP